MQWLIFGQPRVTCLGYLSSCNSGEPTGPIRIVMIQNLLTSARRSTMQLRINRAYPRVWGTRHGTDAEAGLSTRQVRDPRSPPCADYSNADRNMFYAIYHELTICELPNSNVGSAALNFQEFFSFHFSLIRVSRYTRRSWIAELLDWR